MAATRARAGRLAALAISTTNVAVRMPARVMLMAFEAPILVRMTMLSQVWAHVHHHIVWRLSQLRAHPIGGFEVAAGMRHQLLIARVIGGLDADDVVAQGMIMLVNVLNEFELGIAGAGNQPFLRRP